MFEKEIEHLKDLITKERNKSEFEGKRKIIYPDKIKKKIIDLYRKGVKLADMQDILNIHPTSVGKWLKDEKFKEYANNSKEVKVSATLPNGIKIDAGNSEELIKIIKKLGKIIKNN